MKEASDDANYVKNDELVQDILVFQKQYREHKEKGLSGRPVMSDSLGEKIFLVVSRFSTYYKFHGYTFREDMIMDAVEHCIRYIHNFDINQSNNAFGYITMIAQHAFQRRIMIEKKQAITKYKCLENAGAFGLYNAIKKASDGDFVGEYGEFLSRLQISVDDIDKVESRERQKAVKVTKPKENSIAGFFEDAK